MSILKWLKSIVKKTVDLIFGHSFNQIDTIPMFAIETTDLPTCIPRCVLAETYHVKGQLWLP